MADLSALERTNLPTAASAKDVADAEESVAPFLDLLAASRFFLSLPLCLLACSLGVATFAMAATAPLSLSTLGTRVRGIFSSSLLSFLLPPADDTSSRIVDRSDDPSSLMVTAPGAPPAVPEGGLTADSEGRDEALDDCSCPGRALVVFADDNAFCTCFFRSSLAGVPCLLFWFCCCCFFVDATSAAVFSFSTFFAAAAAG
mmetsp:Transcript_1271/g.3442  ORF Transcript_1271/g.3442 Transcript_1271/m.3442 type:complete len:201 (+) Transcript_1271:2333-2935(+)